MKSKFFLLSAAVVMAAACSPQPVYRLKAEAENTYRHQGSEYMVSRIGDTEVVMAYYKHLGGIFSVDVEVVNLGEEDVEVEPASFYYNLLQEPRVPEKALALVGSVSALDPEKELLETDLAESRAVASMKTAAVLDATVEVASLAADIAAISNRDYEYLAVSDVTRAVRSVERSVRYANHDRFLDDLVFRRASWEQDHIRVTDLQPDEFIRGLVSFPAGKEAKYVEIVVPVGGEEHRFLFRLMKYTP